MTFTQDNYDAHDKLTLIRDIADALDDPHQLMAVKRVLDILNTAAQVAIAQDRPHVIAGAFDNVVTRAHATRFVEAFVKSETAAALANHHPDVLGALVAQKRNPSQKYNLQEAGVYVVSLGKQRIGDNAVPAFAYSRPSPKGQFPQSRILVCTPQFSGPVDQWVPLLQQCKASRAMRASLSELFKYNADGASYNKPAQRAFTYASEIIAPPRPLKALVGMVLGGLSN